MIYTTHDTDVVGTVTAGEMVLAPVTWPGGAVRAAVAWAGTVEGARMRPVVAAGGRVIGTGSTHRLVPGTAAEAVSLGFDPVLIDAGAALIGVRCDEGSFTYFGGPSGAFRYAAVEAGANLGAATAAPRPSIALLPPPTEGLEVDAIDLAARAWVDAQRLLGEEGAPGETIAPEVPVSWYDADVEPRRGAFAVVRSDGPYGDLVGDLVQVTYGNRTARVYVVSARDIPYDFMVARRAFLSLAPLNFETINCTLELVG